MHLFSKSSSDSDKSETTIANKSSVTSSATAIDPPTKTSSSKLDLKRFFNPTIFKRSINTSHHDHHDHHNLFHHSEHVDSLDEILLNQYHSKLGPLLGVGAGGSVKLVIDIDNENQLLAIKHFRAKKSAEQTKQYIKNCEAEFKAGQKLHHENIIETKSFFHLHNDYYEIMEYCEHDFFALIMRSNMKRLELNCYFKQLCSGVKYLHDIGIAHRDLKLDNCVVNSKGILKLVDFGSSIIFKSPNEDPHQSYKVRKEVIGSSPYMAPEMFDHIQTEPLCDPRLLDIWSLGIIYCCMTMKKFPWKSPHDTDQSYYLYTLPDEKPHDYAKAAKIHNHLLRERQNQGHLNQSVASLSLSSKTNTSAAPDHETEDARHKNFTSCKIKGPYRLMRLLPHSARPIISRILQVEPRKRANFDQICADEWFSEIETCTTAHKAEHHVHSLLDEEPIKTIDKKGY